MLNLVDVAALPSWYNLFFATFGTAALFRYLDTGGRRWLFVAGVCGGLSILAKVVGLYYVAAALLFLAYREQLLAQRRGWEPPRRSPYTALVVLGSLLFLGLLAQVLWSRLGPRELLHFFLPAAVVVALLLGNERSAGGRARERLAVLLGMALPFLLGVALPVALFLAPYAAAGALSDLLQGVFVAPARRLGFAAMRPPYLLFSTLATAPLLLFLAGERWRRPRRALEAGAVLLLLGGVLVAAREERLVYLLGWYSVRTLGPILVVLGAWTLARRAEAGLSAGLRQGVFLLLCMTAMLGLIQFPFSSPWYFWYVAPFVVLTGGALLSVWGRDGDFAPRAALGFYVLFAVLVVNTGSRYTVGSRYLPETHTAALRLDGARGIRAGGSERADYERVVAAVKARARGGYMYAAPDAPELYFLAGLRNPTPTLFDFFEDPEGRTERVLSALERHSVSVVAINRSPGFSGPVSPELEAALAARFPAAVRVGKFTVRWR